MRKHVSLNAECVRTLKNISKCSESHNTHKGHNTSFSSTEKTGRFLPHSYVSLKELNAPQNTYTDSLLHGICHFEFLKSHFRFHKLRSFMLNGFVYCNVIQGVYDPPSTPIILKKGDARKFDKHVSYRSSSEVSDSGIAMFEQLSEIPETGGNLKILNGNIGVVGNMGVSLDRVYKKKQLWSAFVKLMILKFPKVGKLTKVRAQFPVFPEVAQTWRYHYQKLQTSFYKRHASPSPSPPPPLPLPPPSPLAALEMRPTPLWLYGPEQNIRVKPCFVQSSTSVNTEALFLAEVTSEVTVLFISGAELAATVHCVLLALGVCSFQLNFLYWFKN
ncbi:hypothetical protein EAI_08494 [Harpegnathos saltator]|uniref:Uncharacterized protein n=1 Tax=Harpegnathos saltator TaxID=610380 RepID=E2BEI5_HARSA|nr:hypothetical protein EAI_08494 [Harpegnathos saltator]